MAGHVFISYSHVDAKVVKKLVTWLRRQGICIWIDNKDIPGGSRWPGEIVRGLENSAAVLFCVSGRSVQSDEVVREVQLARKKHRTVVPLYLESVELPPDLELPLVDLHSLNLEAGNLEASYQKVLRTLVSHGVTRQATDEIPVPSPSRRSRYRLFTATGAVGLILLLLVLGKTLPQVNQEMARSRHQSMAVDVLVGLEEGLGTLKQVNGMYTNRTTGVLAIVGVEGSQAEAIPLSLSEIAMALRMAVVSSGEWVGCWLDPLPTGGHEFAVRFGGDIHDTHFGMTLLQADWTLKKYVTAAYTGVNLTSGVVIPAELVRTMSEYVRERQVARYWLTAEPAIRVADTAPVCFVKESGIEVRAVELAAGRDGVYGAASPDPPSGQEVARFLTSHFSEIAAAEASIAAFARLVQVFAAARWVSENLSPQDLGWLESAIRSDDVRTPRTLPYIELTGESVGTRDGDVMVETTMRIQGGVFLDGGRTEVRRADSYEETVAEKIASLVEDPERSDVVDLRLDDGILRIVRLRMP